MTPDELREKTPEELKKLLSEWKEEYFRLKIKKAAGQLEKNHKLKLLRHDLARIFTLQRQKALTGKNK